MKKTGEGKYLRDDLKNYSNKKFERPSVTTDIAICSIINDDLCVLLIKRKFPPFRDCWALPGGFVDLPRKESLEQTAARELYEETHIKGIFFEQLKTYGDPDRDPRMRIITVAYFALLPYDMVVKVKAGDDAKECQWFPLRILPENIAFDHKGILTDVLNRIVGKLSYTPIAFHLLPNKFTWTQLQRVYEVIMGEELQAPNFRREIKRQFSFLEIRDIPSHQGLGRKPVYLIFLKAKKKL